MRDGDGLPHAASSGCSDKWLDLGYVLKIELLGFTSGIEHSPLNFFSNSK